MGKDKLLIRDILYVVLFAALFFLIQFIFEIGGALIYGLGNNLSVSDVITDMSCGKYSKLLTATVVLSSLVTVALYGKLKWAPVSPTYLRSKPWAVIAWVVFLALGSILPLEWIYEHIQISMPGHLSQLFEGIMKEPWGYVAIGLLVPVAEEMVFRGAILRKLLEMFAAPCRQQGRCHEPLVSDNHLSAYLRCHARQRSPGCPCLHHRPSPWLDVLPHEECHPVDSVSLGQQQHSLCHVQFHAADERW